jgi:hypothetical protein
VKTSNVSRDRRIAGDWWKDPIPPNVRFGRGFYCETAQVFRGDGRLVGEHPEHGSLLDGITQRGRAEIGTGTGEQAAARGVRSCGHHPIIGSGHFRSQATGW